MSKRAILVFILTISFVMLLLTACNKNQAQETISPSASQHTETLTPLPEPSKTPIPPTPTQIPLAAIVNGEIITLAELEAEVERYLASVEITGTILASDTRAIVLDELIDQTLLAQSAVKNGFNLDEEMLQARIKSLETQLGSPQALNDWAFAHGYSDEELQQALKRSIEAAWMRDEIIGSVAETADQVHVQQILFPTKSEADEIYTALQYGSDFLELAATYDPITKGELGWFPRGYLEEPEIDEAVFALQPGQYSTVIETEIGYHILYVVERDANHELLPDALRKLQTEALKEWLKEQRGKSEIQLLLP